MRVMVSACLLGNNCKYNGGNNNHVKLKELLQGHEIVPVCPESFGGLPIPRPPAEIVNGVVMNKEGKSVDAEFRLGAQKGYDLAVEKQVELVILQSRSPSCGVNQIYDGTFTGTKIAGHGIFAGLLLQAGIPVMDVEDIGDELPVSGKSAAKSSVNKYSSEPEVGDCGCIYG